MKLKRKYRRRILLTSFIIIVFDVILFSVKPWKYFEEKEEVMVKVEEKIPLNHILNNSMSTFQQTERFDKDIERFMQKWDIKGASFALMKNDNLIYAKGYGYADAEKAIPCEVRHLFRVASVSKLITAVAIMKLKEQGRLSLSDHVFGATGILSDSIFSEINDKRVKDITIEHLLRHQGGFSQRAGDPMFNCHDVARNLGAPLPLKMDDMVRYAAKSRLRNQPGNSTQYSNLGYLVLSKIVEKISGMNYETYVKQTILDSIGCYDMHIGKNYEFDRPTNEVKYYEVNEAEPVKAYDGSDRMVLKSNGGNDVTGLYGAGGWIASPVELLRFITAVDGDTHKHNILSQESIDIMTGFNKRELPIGWARVTENDEWIRTGTLAGTSAIIKRQNDGVTWVFLSNTSSWKGHYFTSFINRMVKDAMTKVVDWPERDLFVESGKTIKSKDSLLVKTH